MDEVVLEQQCQNILARARVRENFDWVNALRFVLNTYAETKRSQQEALGSVLGHHVPLSYSVVKILEVSPGQKILCAIKAPHDHVYVFNDRAQVVHVLVDNEPIVTEVSIAKFVISLNVLSRQYLNKQELEDVLMKFRDANHEELESELRMRALVNARGKDLSSEGLRVSVLVV